MDAVREVCSAALSLRKAKGLRVRLPLRDADRGHARAAALEPFADLIADEVNVKEVVFTDDLAGLLRAGAHRGTAGARPAAGRAVQQVIKAVKAGDWSLVDGAPVAAGVALPDGRVRAEAGRRRRRSTRRRCPAARAWSCWTPRSPRSWPPRGWPGT